MSPDRRETKTLAADLDDGTTAPIGPEDVLSGAPVFHALDPPSRKVLLDLAEEFRVARSRPFDEADSLSPRFYLLVLGRARLYLSSPRESRVLVRILTPGDLFPTLSLTNGLHGSIRIEAMEPCTGLSWPRDALVSLLREHASLSACFLEHESELVADLACRVTDLAVVTAPARLARALLYLGRKIGDDVSGSLLVGARLRIEDLADMAGMPRGVVRRLLAAWRRDETIRFERKVFFVDVHRLERIAFLS